MRLPDLTRYAEPMREFEPIRLGGEVSQVIGLVLESDGPPARIGEVCRLYPGDGAASVLAEVVGFRGDRILLMPLGAMDGIRPGSRVVATGQSFHVPVGQSLLGRILDGMGEPMDGKGPLLADGFARVDNVPPNPLSRSRISEPLPLGVRAMDLLLTCGVGQRLGIFAGSGVGKSTMLGMIARNAKADVNVIALIGERGREVREFIERDLGEDGLARSVVVVATSDQPPLTRIKGAFVATAMAEHFRDQGLKVILMMDSLTRFAMAQREVGLAIGEPPATKGYTPSVFALLPRLLERSGASDRGSITGLYTVLVEGDDYNEPISDTVRGILDGHVILSRDLAARNHYPAIDVLGSVSRVMPEIVPPEHMQTAGAMREVLATYRSAQDLVNIGAYAKGSNPAIDRSLTLIDPLTAILKQGMREEAPYGEALARARELLGT